MNNKLKRFISGLSLVAVLSTSLIPTVTNKTYAYVADKVYPENVDYDLYTSRNLVSMDVSKDEFSGVKLFWGAGGTTEVKVESGGAFITTRYPKPNADWSAADGYHDVDNGPDFSGVRPDPGAKYRITNIGRLASDNVLGTQKQGDSVDVIVTIKNVVKRNPNFEGVIRFLNVTDYTNGGGRGYEVNSMGVWSTNLLYMDLEWEFVKHGTNEGLNLSVPAYWWDIDHGQQIKETFGNKRAIIHKTIGQAMDLDPARQGGLWSKYQSEVAPEIKEKMKNDEFLNETAYVTHGEFPAGSKARTEYWTDREGGGYFANRQPEEFETRFTSSPYSIWFLMFGDFKSLESPPKIPENIFNKTVTDINETQNKPESPNHLGLTSREQQFKLDFDAYGGDRGWKELIVTDDLQPYFKYKEGTARVYQNNHRDITHMFNFRSENNSIEFRLKDEFKEDTSIRKGNFSFEFNVDAYRWLGDIVFNEAILNNGYRTITSNKVNTVIPADGKIVKEVSVDDGNTWNLSEFKKTASLAKHYGADYIWRNTFTLPNLTKYTKIQLHDYMEPIQRFDASKVQIIDDDGRDVTAQGDIQISDGAGGTDPKTVTWTAHQSFIDAVNAKHGKESKTFPVVTMKITANINGTTEDDVLPYVTSELENGEIIIPNISAYILNDDSGGVDYYKKGHPSHVKFPIEIKDGKVSKSVTDLNEKEVTDNHVGLVDRDVMYTLKAKTSFGSKFNSLVVTDNLPAEFTAEAENVVIENAKGEDLTGHFNISIEGNVFKAELKESSLDNASFKDTTLVFYIHGKMQRWLGGISTNVNATFNFGDENNIRITNGTNTVIPADGKIVKENSTFKRGQDDWVEGDMNDDGVDNRGFNHMIELASGKDAYIDYKLSDTPETANQVPHYNNTWDWKSTFKLPNLTDYKQIKLVDIFRDVQKIDLSKVRIYDDGGNDITGLGELTTKKVVAEANGTDNTVESGKTEIIWTAGDEFVKSLNERFGKKSEDFPMLYMHIETDIVDATKSQIRPYVNVLTKDIVLPNDSYFEVIDTESNYTITHNEMQPDGTVTSTTEEADHVYKKEGNTSYVKVNSKIGTPPDDSIKIPPPNRPLTPGDDYPPPVDPNGDIPIRPIKMVSDSNEIDKARNNVGLTKREQIYKFMIETTPGVKFNKFEIEDQFPKEYTVTLDGITITNKEGVDVTNLFDATLEDNLYRAVLKESEMDNPNFKGTILTVKSVGLVDKWLGYKIYNYASFTDEYHTYYSNKVETRVPSEPTTVKSVSADDKNYYEAKTPEEALKLLNRPDSYRWKLDYTLPNYTEYTHIHLYDTFRNLQRLDNLEDDVKVYNWAGEDVTNRGDLTVEVQGDITIIHFEAKRELVEKVNELFGPERDTKPVFTMTVKTDVKATPAEKEAAYYNESVKQVVIPNDGHQTVYDSEGFVSTNSNISNVTFPRPGEIGTPEGPDVHKRVAKSGTENWKATLELDNYDQEYDYKVTYKLSKDMNYDNGKLRLVDIFEDVQSYESIQIFREDGTDVTNNFTITTDYKTNDGMPWTLESEDEGKVKQFWIDATPIDYDTYDDAGETLVMKINKVHLGKAGGKEMAEYLEDNPETPYEEGITIPNIAKLIEKSPVPTFSREKDSNKTFVNYVARPNIRKYVEDDNMVVIDPKTASIESVELKDAIGAAQYLLSEIVKKDPKLIDSGKYFELKKELLNPNVTVRELMKKMKNLYLP